MEAFLESYLNNAQTVIDEFDLEMSRISMEAYIQQEQEYISNNLKMMEELKSEMSMISTQVFIQQQLQFLDYTSKYVTESRKQLVLLQLPTKTHVVGGSQEENTVEICTICQEDYKAGDSVGFLGCRHEFHSECIKEWLVVNNTCPLCKSTGVPHIGRT